MTHKGMIKGNWIELEDAPGLPEGTEVEVVIQESLVRGSPQALLAYWNRQPACSPEDVAALIREMEQRHVAGRKRPMDRRHRVKRRGHIGNARQRL